MSTELYVNGRFLTRRMTGVDRYAMEVMDAIDALLVANDPCVADLKVHVLVPPGHVISHSYQKIPITSIGTHQGVLWEQWDLARLVPKNGLLLSLCNTGPAFKRNHVVVIHDAGTERMPAGFSRAFRWWYRILMPLLGRNSRRVLTVSAFSKRELTQVYAIPETRISVVGEGAEHILRAQPEPKALERFGLGERPYLLAVSSMAVHKNFQLVLDALALLDEPPFDVAIAGGANARIFGVAGAARSERVRWLGYVSDAELRTLYSGALGFVFPSLYEGFGLPPLEAMACGCPVLASNAASIPEACGDAALYFDPCDAAGLKAAMLLIANDAALRTDMVGRGHRQVATWSWQRGARQVLAACDAVNRGA